MENSNFLEMPGIGEMLLSINDLFYAFEENPGGSISRGKALIRESQLNQSDRETLDKLLSQIENFIWLANRYQEQLETVCKSIEAVENK